MTQKDRVIRHLQDCGSITTMEAIKEYGITRLSQYILLLRKENFNITSNWTKGINRYGEQTDFVSYKLEKI